MPTIPPNFILCFVKLSPNLRKRTREAQMAILSHEPFLLKDIEIKKLEKLLSQVIFSYILHTSQP